MEDTVMIIPFQRGSKMKDAVVKMPIDKLIHKRILGKVMLLVGETSPNFELLGENLTFK